MTRIVDQYRILTEGAGWIDKRPRGRLRFVGRDAASFLNALVSNDVASLRPGQGCYATYLTAQGRLITDLRLYRFDEDLLADVAAGQAARLAVLFDRLIFADEVQVSDVSESLSQVAVIGASAATGLARVFDLTPERLASLGRYDHVLVGDVVIARTDDVELPSLDLFMPTESYGAITARLSDAGAREISPELFGALRIEAGHPAFGLDMTEETIPLEAGLLERAISTAKGCYVGQEVIIRVLHRGSGRVAKRLVKLTGDAALQAVPPAGTRLISDAREVGRITSAAISPSRQQVVALGYLRRDRAEPGVHVTAHIEGHDHTLTVERLAG